MKSALYSINQLNHQILVPKSSAIAPPPTFDDFRFSTIGQQPQLLKRFTAPDTQHQQYLSPTPSPGPEVQQSPPTSESTPLSVPKARLSLFEALADGNTTTKNMLTDDPVDQRQNMPSKGVVVIGNSPVPPIDPGKTTFSSSSAQQDPVPNNTSDALSSGRPTALAAAAALPETSLPPPLSSSTQTTILPPTLHPLTIQAGGPIDPTPAPSRLALQNIRSRLRNSLTTLNAASSPMPSPTLSTAPVPVLSEILQHVHQAAQLSVSNISSCLLSAQAAHTLAQQSMHASEHSLALVQQSLTAAQDAHATAKRSSAEAQVSLSGAMEARGNAEELLRVIGRMEVAIRSQERDIESREDVVRREVLNTRTAVELFEAWVAEEGTREEEQRLKMEKRRLEVDRRNAEIETRRMAEVEADIAREAWNQDRSRLSEKEVDERMQVDENPSAQPVNPEVARPNFSAARSPQPDTPVPTVSSIQQRADPDPVHREPEPSNGTQPREPPEALVHAQRDEEARKEEEAQRRREKEEEERVRLLQEKKRAAVQSEKKRVNEEAAVKIRTEREAKLKGTLANRSPGASPMKGVVFGNPVSNKILLPSSPDKIKPVSDNAKLGAGNPSAGPPALSSHPPIVTPALPLTPARPSVIAPTLHQHQLPKKPIAFSSADSSKALASQKFVPAVTDIGKRVNTEAPLSSIVLASEGRQNPDGASTNVNDNRNGAIRDAPQSSLPPYLPLGNSLDPSPQSGDDVGSAPLGLPASRPPSSPRSSPMIVSPTSTIFNNFKRSDSDPANNIEMGDESRRVEIGAPPSSSYAEQVSNLRHLASESGVKIKIKLEPKVKDEPSDDEAAPARKANGTDFIPDANSAPPSATQPSSLISPPLGHSVVPTASTDASNSPPARRMKLPSISNFSKSLPDKTLTSGVVNGGHPPTDSNQPVVNTATGTRQVNDTTRDILSHADNIRQTDKRQGSSGSDGRQEDAGPRREVEERSHQQVTPQVGYPARRPSRRSLTPDHYELHTSRPNTRRNMPPRSPPRREIDHYSPPRSLGPSRHPLPPNPTISNRKRAREDCGPTSHSELHPPRRQRQEESEINRGRPASQRLDSSKSYRSQESTLARRLQQTERKGDRYVPTYSDDDRITGDAEMYPSAAHSAARGPRDEYENSAHATPLFLPESSVETESIEQQPGLLGRMSDRAHPLPSASARAAANSNRRVSERIRGGFGKGRGGVGRGNTRDLASRLATPLQERLD